MRNKSYPQTLTSRTSVFGLALAFAIVAVMPAPAHGQSQDIWTLESSIKHHEIAQFMVALTRTRKQCHIISNKWMTPKNKSGEWNAVFVPSIFFDWLPKEWYINLGESDAKAVKSLSWD